MAVASAAGGTAWARGRFDAREGKSQLLFGRMHEDSGIELGAFPPGGRVFCIASAGCTAIALSRSHEVVAVDVNPSQVAYARRRFAGQPGARGSAERVMAALRALAPLAGWRAARVREFLELDEPARQLDFWSKRLDTRRFRAALDVLMSRPALRAIYGPTFLDVLPPRFGRVLRSRIERVIARHPNRTNPYARALLLGEPPPEAAAPATVRLVLSDAASFLEGEEPGKFDGFSLSNILDGADEVYAGRLSAAVRRSAAPGAIAVIRSFREPPAPLPDNRAEEDRSMLWGIVRVARAERL